MRGSILADQIMREEQRKEYFRKKKRKQCIVDKEKQCLKCEYRNICDGVEDENEI